MRDILTRMEAVVGSGRFGGGGVVSDGEVDAGNGGGAGGVGLGTASFSSTQRLFTRDKLDFSPAFFDVDFLLSRFV